MLDTAQLSKEQRETLENWLNQAKRPEAQLLDDIEQVLKKEQLLPEVRSALEEASESIANGTASSRLTELVRTQTKRIIDGTDRPYALTRETATVNRQEPSRLYKKQEMVGRKELRREEIGRAHV